MILNGTLIIIDLIWIFSVGNVWTTWLKTNKVWDDLMGIHKFSIFMSIVNIFLKFGIIFAINMYRSK